MKKVKIQIVEDELIIANDIAELLEENGYEITDICGNFEDSVASFQRKKPDLVILDIVLNQHQASNIDGVRIGETIHKLSDIPIIYLTGQPNVKEAFATNPANYLTKPIRERDLLNAIELALVPKVEEKQILIRDFFFIKDGYTHKKFFYKDILYIQADGVYINIYTTQAKKYNFAMKLIDYIQAYPHLHFVRVNRSYIVNLNQIDSFDHNILIINGLTIRMTRNQDVVMKYLMPS